MLNKIRNAAVHAMNIENKSFILQQHVANPLLINNKKFHLRIYILLIWRKNVAKEMWM